MNPPAPPFGYKMIPQGQCLTGSLLWLNCEGQWEVYSRGRPTELTQYHWVRSPIDYPDGPFFALQMEFTIEEETECHATEWLVTNGESIFRTRDKGAAEWLLKRLQQ